jgi:hypothetical protein
MERIDMPLNCRRQNAEGGRQSLMRATILAAEVTVFNV